MRQFFLLGLLTLLFPFALSAQNITVSGKVFDASTNEPLVGVTVVQTGTQNGTITDIDGNYSISCPGDASLTFSYIGYVTNTVFVNGKTNLPVNLEPDNKTLDEIVVVGYGTQRKSDLTGSVASVSGDDMKNRATSDAAAALQGKAAGVQVLTGSGAPGTGSEIRVRGVSSNSGNLGPLLIVDGLKVDNIQYLDPEMIESMEILKDAASAAIYGAQAGNGVVLITTKNGSKSKDGTIFYNGQWSLSSLSRDIQVMEADQYRRYLNDIGLYDDEKLKGLGYNGANIKMQDEVFEPTWNSRHTVGFQGGNDRGSYFVAVNHVKYNGIFVGDKDRYKRFTLQANADYKIKKWLTVSTNNSLEKWETKSVSQQNDNGTALLGAITTDPLFPLICDYDDLNATLKGYIDEGKPVLMTPDGRYYQLSPVTGNTQSANPLMRSESLDSKSSGISLRGLASLNFNPIEGLVYTSRFGYRVAQQNGHTYEYPFYANSFVQRTKYSISANANTNYYYQFENFINYNKTFADKHSIGAMIGMSWEESVSDNVSTKSESVNENQYIFKGQGDNFHYVDYVLSDIKPTVNNLPSDARNMSYFGRLSYTYDNRYSIQFNLRADAFDSSKLSKEERWGKFPSFSAGWTVSNESFFKDNISTDIISFLKLRGSWGKNGNINVLSGYRYAPVMETNSAWYMFGTDDTRNYGSKPNGIANPSLVWEESKQIDLGLDARFLNSRLTLAIDWYKKTTDGLLVNVKPNLETGIGSLWLNAGDVENKGLEVELGWKDKIAGELNYSVNANIATLKNELTDLNPAAGGFIGGQSPQGSDYMSTRCSIGEPIWYIYGYNAIGIDEKGQAVYEDRNGDETIDADDRTNIGSGLPKFTYGITINLEYKGFDLAIFGTGAQGNKAAVLGWRKDRAECNNYRWYYNNSWLPSNTNAKFPRPDLWGADDKVYSSNLVIHDASYFKIKQIQLGYTLPKTILNKVYVNSMRVYASLENFFTFTHYFGIDPETASANNSDRMGFDYGTYPTAKQVVFGVNVTF